MATWADVPDLVTRAVTAAGVIWAVSVVCGLAIAAVLRRMPE